MLNVHLYLAQRLTAVIMAPLLLGHLAVILYAVRGGVSAAEILSRTQGSLWWGAFYGLLVVAASVHGAIGLRVVAHEHLGVKGRALGALTALVMVSFLALGLRAVVAVTL